MATTTDLTFPLHARPGNFTSMGTNGLVVSGIARHTGDFVSAWLVPVRRTEAGSWVGAGDREALHPIITQDGVAEVQIKADFAKWPLAQRAAVLFIVSGREIFFRERLALDAASGMRPAAVTANAARRTAATDAAASERDSPIESHGPTTGADPIELALARLDRPPGPIRPAP